MALSILFGTGTQDRELALLNRVNQVIKQDPTAKVFYLVPNHIKFETEIRVLQRLAQIDQRISPVIASNQIQVFSMSRLAWYYMNESKLYQHANLSQNAMTMLVQAVLKEHADELQLYGALLNKPGFIEQFTKQLMELKQSGLTWDDVAKLSDQSQANVVLQRKLHDLAVVGKAFQSALGDREQYLSSDLLGILKLYLQNDQADLRQHHFYIDGYSQMTTQERGVVEALITKSAGVTIALPADGGAGAITEQGIADNDLFLRPKLLGQQLRDYAVAAGQQVEIKTVSDLRSLSQTMHNISNYWIEYEQHGVPQTPLDAPDLMLWQTTSRYQEVEQMARFIRQEVATGKRRYRDFLLLTPDLSQYANVMPALFNRYELPYFMDLDRPMNAHPLVAMLDNLLALAPHYQLTDVMNLLKSELFLPAEVTLAEYREALAITENFVLAKNFSGWRWSSTEAWYFDHNISEDDDAVVRERVARKDAQLALIHDQISQQVAPFLQDLATAKTARQLAAKLYQFLVTMHVDERLLAWRDAAVAQGDLFAASQPEQVWREFVNVLDDFVAVFGDTPMAVTDLSEALTAAFGSAKYNAIPATMDQVLVSETGIVQNIGAHTVIIFGATSANLPVTIRQHALLQDNDRLALKAILPAGINLRETADEAMAQDSLLIYNAMMSAQERLVWAYSTSDGESGLKASMYVSRLAKGFDKAIMQINALPSVDDDADQVLLRLGSIGSSLANLVLAKQTALKAAKPLSLAWQSLDEQLRILAPDQYKQVMASLQYSNLVEQLQHPLVVQLFGDDLKASISRLETYARNPYEYFLRFGLKLVERQEMQMTPAEKGTFMHDVLENVFTNLAGEPLGDLSAKQITDLENRVVEQILLADNPTYDIFKSTKRMELLTDSLAQQVHLALLNMQRGQLPGQGIKTLGTEAGFGLMHSDFQPVNYALDNGGSITIRGKVDRYDVVHDATTNTDYLAIVDYKSSDRKFEYHKAYAGLELQLMTYWAAMIKNANRLPSGAQMAAATFWSLKNPLIKAQDVVGTTYQEMTTKADQAVMEQGKYRGLLLADEQFIEQLEAGDAQPPYMIKRKKDDSFGATSEVVSASDLAILQAFNEAKIKAMAQNILTGDFPLQPYRDGQKTALEYSEYKPIMRFDALMGDRYNDINKQDKATILTAMADFATNGKEDA
ncbi:MAG: PD-(D/E)XK nuclease family protein [Lactobacillaceae bacterium]|jgi:ATP-dependent helicase/nuclease subunit B|nr:PD-(D/E)XK nuclease family protein [Lactobacillaceae bacterium]